MVELIIFIILTLVILIPLGKRVSKVLLRNESLSFLAETYINFGLGAGLLALIILYIGLVGLLYRWLILAVLAGLAVFLAKDIRDTARNTFTWLSNVVRIRLLPFERVLILFLILVWFFTLIGSLSPLLGMDALSYHMRDPKLFIKAHQITQLPYTRDSLWPFLIQMLFTLGLLLKGPVLAKLFHFTFGIFSVAGIYILCRRYWPRVNSLLACAIFALIPSIFTITTYAYTDLAVVFYTILAFYAFFIWLDTKNKRWFYLAGASCGFLLGIKIVTAVVPVLIIFLYMFNTIGKVKNTKERLMPLVIFILIMIALSGIWYIRSWLIVGNPIFPFAAYLFGGCGYPEEHLRYHLTSGIGIGISQYFRIPWLITHYPDRFGGESIGPVFLIFLPLLFFIKKPSRFIKYIIFIAVFLYTSWFLIYQYVRFLAPTLIFLSVLVSYVYFDVCKKDKIIYAVSRTVLILVFSYSTALSAYHNIDKLGVTFGFEKRGDYLLRRERSYAIADYINKNLPEDSKILVLTEPRLFYFDREVGMAVSAKLNMRYDRNINYSGSFDDYLRSEGFRYILYVKDNSPGRKSKIWFRPDDVLVGDDKVLIKEIEFAYRDERYTYQLFKINPVRNIATKGVSEISNGVNRRT